MCLNKVVIYTKNQITLVCSNPLMQTRLGKYSVGIKADSGDTQTLFAVIGLVIFMIKDNDRLPVKREVC